jgi:hypothetical protein
MATLFGKKKKPDGPLEERSSGTFRVRKRDGVVLQKKTVWLDESLAQQFDIYCAANRLDMSEVVAHLLTELLAGKR